MKSYGGLGGGSRVVLLFVSCLLHFLFKTVHLLLDLEGEVLKESRPLPSVFDLRQHLLEHLNLLLYVLELTACLVEV